MEPPSSALVVATDGSEQHRSLQQSAVWLFLALGVSMCAASALAELDLRRRLQRQWHAHGRLRRRWRAHERMRRRRWVANVPVRQ